MRLGGLARGNEIGRTGNEVGRTGNDVRVGV